MTDTFTPDQIKQIEAAIIKVAETIAGKTLVVDPDKVIAELTKPKWTPQVREVYGYRSSNENHSNFRAASGMETNADNVIRRPLTPSELPALKVAIEALDKLSKLGNGGRVVGNSEGNVLAQTTLAKIKELTGG